MPTKMSREGRWLDIVRFIHKAEIDGIEDTTIGEYCRKAGLGKSPYISGEFEALVGQGILICKQQPYKSTFKKVYAVHYDNVSEFYPELHKAITDLDRRYRLD